MAATLEQLRQLYGTTSDEEAILKLSQEYGIDPREVADEVGYKYGGQWSNRASASIDSYQANMYGLAGALGSDWAAGRQRANDAAADLRRSIARQQGAIFSYKDIGGIGDVPNYIGGLAVDSAPYLAEAAVGGLLGRGLALGSRAAASAAAEMGMQAPRQAANLTRAASAGVVAASYPSSVGDILASQREQAGATDFGAAAAYGVPYAALNLVGLEGAFARGLPRAGRWLDDVPGIRGGLARAGVAGGVSAIGEGINETGQEVMNQLGRMAVDPRATLTDPAALERYGESFIGGAALGQVAGSSLGGWRRSQTWYDAQREAVLRQYEEELRRQSQQPIDLLQTEKPVDYPSEVGLGILPTINPYDVGGYVTRFQQDQDTTVGEPQYGIFGGGGEPAVFELPPQAVDGAKQARALAPEFLKKGGRSRVIGQVIGDGDPAGIEYRMKVAYGTFLEDPTKAEHADNVANWYKAYTGNDITQGAQNAVQVQSPAPVDVRQRPQDGGAVVQGNPQGVQAAREGFVQGQGQSQARQVQVTPSNANVSIPVLPGQYVGRGGPLGSNNIERSMAAARSDLAANVAGVDTASRVGANDRAPGAVATGTAGLAPSAVTPAQQPAQQPVAEGPTPSDVIDLPKTIELIKSFPSKTQTALYHYLGVDEYGNLVDNPKSVAEAARLAGYKSHAQVSRAAKVLGISEKAILRMHAASGQVELVSDQVTPDEEGASQAEKRGDINAKSDASKRLKTLTSLKSYQVVVAAEDADIRAGKVDNDLAKLAAVWSKYAEAARPVEAGALRELRRLIQLRSTNAAFAHKVAVAYDKEYGATATKDTTDDTESIYRSDEDAGLAESAGAEEGTGEAGALDQPVQADQAAEAGGENAPAYQVGTAEGSKAVVQVKKRRTVQKPLSAGSSNNDIAGLGVLPMTEATRVTYDELLQEPHMDMAHEMLRQARVDNALNWVSEWHVFGETDKTLSLGWLDGKGDGTYRIAINFEPDIGPARVALTLAHEVGHAVDMVNEGGVYSTQPEFDPVNGEVINELKALYNNPQQSSIGELLAYPFAPNFGLIDNPWTLRKEAFAQLFSFYTNRYLRSELAKYAPKAHAFIQQVADHVQKRQRNPKQDQRTASFNAAKDFFAARQAVAQGLRREGPAGAGRDSGRAGSTFSAGKDSKATRPSLSEFAYQIEEDFPAVAKLLRRKDLNDLMGLMAQSDLAQEEGDALFWNKQLAGAEADNTLDGQIKGGGKLRYVQVKGPRDLITIKLSAEERTQVEGLFDALHTLFKEQMGGEWDWDKANELAVEYGIHPDRFTDMDVEYADTDDKFWAFVFGVHEASAQFLEKELKTLPNAWLNQKTLSSANTGQDIDALVRAVANTNRLQSNVAERIRSRMTPASRDSWANITDKLQKIFPRLLTNFQLKEQYGKDSKHKLGELDAHVGLSQEMTVTRMRLAQIAHETSVQWDKLPTATKQLLHGVMLDATLQEIHPDRAFGDEGNEHLTEGQRVAHGQLRQRYNALPTEAKNVYQRALGDLKAQWDERQKTINGLAEYAYKKRIDEATRNGDDERVKELTKEKDAFIKDYGRLLNELKGPYFPLARFGEYLIIGESQELRTLKDQIEEATGDERRDLQKQIDRMEKDAAHYDVAARESKGQANAAQREMEARGLIARTDMADQNLSGMRPMSQLMLDRVTEMISAEFDKDVAGKVNQALTEVFLSALPEMHALRREAKRKGIAGATTDMLRAYAATSQQNAFYISRLQYGTKMIDNLFAMKQKVKGDTALQHIHRELEQRMALDMQYKQTPVQDLAASMSWVYHLGISPSFMFINATQPWLVTGPVLSGKFGAVPAMKALKNAAQDALAVMRDARFKNGKWDMWSGISEASVKQPDERLAIRKLLERGIVDEGLQHELNMFADDSSRKLARFNRFMGWTTQQIEMVNRLTTALAAYRLARQNGVEFEAATDYAYNTTLATQFDYSAEGTARFMREGGGIPLARLIFQFRRYQQAMLYLLGSNIRKLFDEEEAATARKTLAYVTVSSALSAGVLGMPFFGVWLFITNLLGDDDDPEGDAETKVRNWLTDITGDRELATVFAKGLPAAFGADLSRRIGLGDVASPFPLARFDGRTGQDQVGQLLLNVMGPVGGMASRFYDGWQRYAEGDWAKGTEKIAPKFLSDVVRGGRYAVEGLTDGNNAPTGTDLSGWDVTLRTLGISPTEEANYYEGTRAIKNVQDAYKKAESKIGRVYKEGLRSGDMSDARQAIQEFNRRHPENPIKPKDEMRWRKEVRDEGKNRAPGTGVRLARKSESAYNEVARFATQ